MKFSNYNNMNEEVQEETKPLFKKIPNKLLFQPMWRNKASISSQAANDSTFAVQSPNPIESECENNSFLSNNNANHEANTQVTAQNEENHSVSTQNSYPVSQTPQVSSMGYAAGTQQYLPANGVYGADYTAPTIVQPPHVTGGGFGTVFSAPVVTQQYPSANGVYGTGFSAPAVTQPPQGTFGGYGAGYPAPNGYFMGNVPNYQSYYPMQPQQQYLMPGFYNSVPYDCNIIPEQPTVSVTMYPDNIHNTQQRDNSQSEKVYYEDLFNCAIYEAEISTSEINKIEEKNKLIHVEGVYVYTKHIDQKNLSKFRHRQKKLANFIITKVLESEEWYQVNVRYKASSEKTEDKKLNIPKQSAADSKKLCRFIKGNGIPCEDVNGNVLFTLIVHKAVKIETPYKAGWNRLNGKTFYATKETLAENNYPLIADKSFDVNGNADESPMETIAEFCGKLSAFGNVRLVFFFVIVRMMGILTGVLASVGIRFMRFIAADIDSDKLCRLLQVYDRNTLMDPLSVDQKKLDVVLSDKHDEVVVFNDKVKNKKDATAIVNALYRRCYKDTASELVGRAKDFNLSNDFLVVLASGFLGSLLRPEQVLHVSCTEKDFNTDADMNIFQRSNIGIDRMLIKHIINEDGITEFILSQYEQYKADKAVKDESFANDYAILMSVYALVEKLTHGYAELPVSEEEMKDYLTETFISSMKHEQLTGISNEFRKVLNDLVMSGEIVLMKAKFKELYADPAASRIICCEDDYLYIRNETFDRISDLMKLPENANQVRKAIKPYLKCDKSGEKETYKYSVRIGKSVEKVTAVSTKMLSPEASLKIQERLGFVINTDDGIERIHIGSDTLGQKYYWSIGHEEAAKSHLVLTGKTRMGKTCAMNYVAKQLYNNGHQVVYISFKNGEPKSNLLKHGYNQQEIDENFVFIPIKDMVAKDIELSHGKIVVFYCSKFCDMVEDIAQKIYDYISDESEREAFVVIDEAHNLSHAKESAMYYMYNMGAGNGLHLITSYQTFSELKPKETDIIQGDIVICFKAVSVEEGKKTAEMYGQKPYTAFGRELASLKKQQCYLIGELENSDGEIDNPPAVMVKIPKVDQ